MLSVVFQSFLLLLVFISFILVVGIPVVFASPNGWNENKNYIVLGVTTWTLLVFAIGIFNKYILRR